MARPPLVLSVYEVRRATKLVEFVPGYGGDLQFTPRGNIVHLWGCGSNCHAFAVYDLTGQTVVSDVVSGLDASPDRRLLATFPSLFDAEEGLVVYDLETGNREFATDPALDGAFVVHEVRWLAAKIEFGLTDRGGVSRRLLVERTSAGKLRASFPDGRPTRVPKL